MKNVSRRRRLDKQTKKELMSDPENWDFSLSNKRIQLVKTLDPYTKLKPGDLGTIEYVIKNTIIEDQISVQWDNGSNLMMLVGLDEYIVLDHEVIENV
jgi:hypothetical protein